MPRQKLLFHCILQDLLELVDRYKDRIGTFHFKDINKEAMLANQAAGKPYLEGVRLCCAVKYCTVLGRCEVADWW